MAFAPDQEKLPVYINNFNRLTHMLLLIKWLEQISYVEIVILDNASTYPPLLEWYRATKHKVMFLGQNVGHLALWEHKGDVQIPYQREGDWFAYTDSDIVPREDCPLSLFSYLRQVMLDHPGITKAGPGIEIDDLPNCYPLKNAVQGWERQYWKDETEPGLYNAKIDTTMALYTKTRVPSTDPQLPPPHVKDVRHLAIRTGYPYVVRHLPWYIDPANIPEEEKFFIKHMKPVSTWPRLFNDMCTTGYAEVPVLY